MIRKLLLPICISLGVLLASPAHATTTTVFFSSGDTGGNAPDPLPSLTGLESIQVYISFLSSANGRPNTDIPGNYDLTTTIIGDATVLGITLPTSINIQDQGVLEIDDPYYDDYSPNDAAYTDIFYTFSKADLITAKANGSQGSRSYSDTWFSLSGTAVNIDTNDSVDWQFYGLNDASTYGWVTITTMPEPAVFALFGLGVLGIVLRRR
jgi:hypothetical protein